jgi:two-component system, cell cycle response regulator DivK
MYRSLVYVVDDDPAICSLYSDILCEAGYATRAFSDGIEMMANLRDDHPQAILLDISMPWVSGIFLSRAIKSDHVLRDTPIVIVTGRTRHEVESEFGKSRAECYLHKSEAPARLVEIVRAVTGQRFFKD